MIKKPKKSTESTVGSKKMYKNGELVDKGQYGKDVESFKPRSAPITGTDKNRKLYEEGIKSRKSGTTEKKGRR